MTRPSSPPSAEIGYVVQTGMPGWSYFGQAGLDDIVELQWPNRNRVYHNMRTDAQVDALIRSIVMPLLRLKWTINPNGAKDEVVEDVSTQLNLPIQGNTDEFIQRGRKRFNHAEHLRMCLLAPTVYGHMFFEMVGDVDPVTLAWKLKKLSPRMPQTLSAIEVARDGGLVGIKQFATNAWQADTIPVSQLVAYPWEMEGGNWAGRSMLRPLYKHWLIKDRLLRIDAMKNERYGLGIPYGTAAPGGDPAAMQRMASSVRAVEEGGVGLPNGSQLGIAGISGALPDTIGSMRYQDELMARSFLAMFMQLGQTETGSRALGDSFVDFFVDALAGVANWYKNITSQHVIEDIVDWNWGEDENAPLLEWEQRDEDPLSVSDLANLIKSGALVVDNELENWIRRRFRMPEYTGAVPLPTKPGDVVQDDPSAAPVAAGGVPSKGTPKDKRLKRNRAKITKAYSPDQARDHAGKWIPTDQQRDDDIAEAESASLPAGRESLRAHIQFLGARGCDGQHHTGYDFQTVMAASQTATNATVGHRQPNSNEVKAATDFAKMQQQWTQTTADVVDEWGSIRADQITALTAAVEAAVKADDATALATLSAPVLGSDVILKHMTAMATAAIADAKAEAKAQGVTAPAVDVGDLALDKRADAVAALLARDLGASASRNALLRYGAGAGMSASDVAAGVKEQLESLTDAYLNDTLGGAMTQAQNSGRRATIEAASDASSGKTQIYASELLDQNTCEECASEDGTEFDSVGDSQDAYPAGGYVDCLGGPRCRGTLVAVYGES